MTEVEVRNFQSVEHATIKVEGFTALVGRSNIGKSALVRAVKCALTGATGTSFVRHVSSCARRLSGAKACRCYSSVRIKRESFDLLWEKGDGVNRYTFNGNVYDSVGSGTPSFLLDGYAAIKIGDSKEILQVSDQFDPIFLLNQTGGVIADVLSDVAHLDRVNIAMRMAEKDRREAVSTRKVREQDVAQLQQSLVLYDGLDVTVSRVRDVEEQLVKVERADRKFRQIERFLENGSARTLEINSLAGVENVAVMDVTPLRERVESFQVIQGWLDRLLVFKAWFDAMKGVTTIKDIHTLALQEHSAQYSKTLTLADGFETTTTTVDALTAVGTFMVPSVAALQTSYGQLNVLAGMTTRHEAVVREMQRLEAAHQQAVEDQSVVTEEWSALGICPTCEQSCGGHAKAV